MSRPVRHGDERSKAAVQRRVEDAEILWRLGRREGAFTLALVAVASAARHVQPGGSDREAFEAFLRGRFPWRISVEYRGEQVPIETLFYKQLRCQLIHEGELADDVEFLDGVPEDQLVVQAGGSPNFKLKVSPGWFHKLVGCAVDVV